MSPSVYIKDDKCKYSSELFYSMQSHLLILCLLCALCDGQQNSLQEEKHFFLKSQKFSKLDLLLCFHCSEEVTDN